MSPQRSKNQGSSQESGGTCVCVNATSPGMLLAATALTPLPRLLQDCISAYIVQVGATGAAEQQAELSLAGRVWYQEVSATGRMLTATISPKTEILITKNQGSSQESGGTCVFERNPPRVAACRHRTDPFTAAFAGLHFCAHRAGWRNRSGRTTGRAFAGRSGLLSGDVYERETAASVSTERGRDPNQQKPHFQLDGVRAQAAR